jgi:ketosteroid isomerase-like protein
MADNKMIERIYIEWDKALSNNDADALLALYSDDAVLESPVVTHLTGNNSGEIKGKKALYALFKEVAARKPEVRKYYRNGYLSDGHLLVFEYPRNNPEGEQMDFMEVMEINNEGLIEKHRVYWGWYGLGILSNDQYHRNK